MYIFVLPATDVLITFDVTYAHTMTIPETLS
jgi:hypothetical protein